MGGTEGSSGGQGAKDTRHKGPASKSLYSELKIYGFKRCPRVFAAEKRPPKQAPLQQPSGPFLAAQAVTYGSNVGYGYRGMLTFWCDQGSSYVLKNQTYIRDASAF
ncbi:hypothetical protein M8C21_011120, partial [Ambrosia artemisiifolia]